MKVKYILLSVVLLLMAGCTDILDKKDIGAVTDEDVWNDSKYATAYLNKLCRDNLPGWDEGIAANSEETVGGGALMHGQLETNSINYWPYSDIRKINLLLEKIGTGSIDEESQKTIKAQAVFLRAWRYFNMVRLYGGVPMIMKAQTLDEDLYVARNKTSECINLILDDLDYSISILPWEWTGSDVGRITKAAALAVKARVLLYYASPQFNPNNDKGRWETAYAINKEAKESLAQNGYGLFDSFENLWFTEMNSEDVFVTRYEEPGCVNTWNAATRPLSEAQNHTGANRPCWDIVKAFPMIDGSPIEESNLYDPIYYWKNRDPRFYSTIVYNGMKWELSRKSGRIQWTYNGAEEQFATPTGFYCRKAIDKSYTPYYTERSSTDWVEIRYAEVLLNFAECAAELGKTEEAYGVLKMIRARAGILPGMDNMYGLQPNLSQEDLVTAILNERKVEFAFEGKRYWDLRRRKLFAELLNGTKRERIFSVLKIDESEFDKIKDKIDIDTEYANYFTDEIRVIESDEKYIIDFKDNYYFFAIPKEHLERNSKLEQTKGWDDGSFDPLQ